MFKKGTINEIGTGDNAGMYRVYIADEDIVTGWLTQLRMSALDDKVDWVFAKDEFVTVGFYDEDYRDGFIIGAPNNNNQQPQTTDANKVRTTFKDDSYIEYDKQAHKYTLYVKSGDVNITSDGGKVVINGGNNHGIPNVADLKTKLNNLEQLVNDILTTLKSTTIPLAPSGTYPFAPLYSSFNNLTPTQQADIEDTNATH